MFTHLKLKLCNKIEKQEDLYLIISFALESMNKLHCYCAIANSLNYAVWRNILTNFWEYVSNK